MTKLYPKSCDGFEVPITITLYGSVCDLIPCSLMDISQILEEAATSVLGRRGQSSVIFSARNMEAVGSCH